MEFVLTSSTGLGSLLLMGVIVSIPYMTRWLRKRFGSSTVDYAIAIGLHQGCGYVLLALAVIHMYASMGGGMALRVNPVGLNAATLGLLLLLAQVALGMTRPQGEGATAMLAWRRIHLIVMLGIVAVVAIHVWLNGMLIYKIL